MKDLKELQKAFVSGLLSEEDGSIANEIIPGGTLTANSALDVYRQGYFARLTEALGETYESIWWALGDEDFFAVCKEYIKQQPSSFYNLSDFGQDMAQFLSHSHYSEDIPFLQDLAQFEWQFKELFHRKDHGENTRPQTPPTEKSIFNFSPSCLLFKSPYSIYEVWKQRTGHSDESIEIDINKPQWLLLRKLNNDIFINPLSESQYDLYEALKEKNTLAEALDQLSAKHTDITDLQVQQYFQELTEFNIINEIVN